MASLKREPAMGQSWTHYKGGRYTIVGVGIMEENGRTVVHISCG